MHHRFIQLVIFNFYQKPQSSSLTLFLSLSKNQEQYFYLFLSMLFLCLQVLGFSDEWFMLVSLCVVDYIVDHYY